jgi:ribosomal-protein-alanine N-acetyltransferase
LPQTFIVAESEGHVVGYIMCRIEHGFSDLRKLHFAKKGHIISVAVIPEFRRIGVGRALVENALSALSSLSGDECYLEVRISNGVAIELYKRIGFQIVRTISRYYYDGSDAYMMCKSIQSIP